MKIPASSETSGDSKNHEDGADDRLSENRTNCAQDDRSTVPMSAAAAATTKPGAVAVDADDSDGIDDDDAAMKGRRDNLSSPHGSRRKQDGTTRKELSRLQNDSVGAISERSPPAQQGSTKRNRHAKDQSKSTDRQNEQHTSAIAQKQGRLATPSTSNHNSNHNNDTSEAAYAHFQNNISNEDQEHINASLVSPSHLIAAANLEEPRSSLLELHTVVGHPRFPSKAASPNHSNPGTGQESEPVTHQPGALTRKMSRNRAKMKRDRSNNRSNLAVAATDEEVHNSTAGINGECCDDEEAAISTVRLSQHATSFGTSILPTNDPRPSSGGSTMNLPRAALVETDDDRSQDLSQQPTIISMDERRNILQQAEQNAQARLRQSTVQATAVNSSNANATSGREQTKSRAKVYLGVLCLVVLIAIGIIVGVIVTTNRSNNNDDNTKASEITSTIMTLSPSPTLAPSSTQTSSPIFAPPTAAANMCTSNDRCACAYAINEADFGKPLWGNTINATDDPVDSCDGIDTNGRGVWYRVTIGDAAQDQTRRISASLCEDTDVNSASQRVMTNYDTQLSVFVGDNCDRLSCLAGNDQGGSGCEDSSRLAFTTDPLTTYYVYVHGFRSSRGAFQLQMNQMPDNLVCENAIDISGSPALFGSTKGAPSTEMDNCGGFTVVGPGVWYKATSPSGLAGLRFLFAVRAMDEGFTPSISVFVGDDCGSLTCLAFTTDGEASVLLEDGAQYYAFVHSLGIEEVDFSIFFGMPSSGGGLRPPDMLCEDAFELVVGSTPEWFEVLSITSEVDKYASCGSLVLIKTAGSELHKYRGTWFTTTGTGATFRVSTCDEATNVDTQISVFAGEDCDELRCIDANNDATAADCGSGQSTLEWFAEDGAEYKVLVHTTERNWPEELPQFTISLDELDLPSNGACQDAIDVFVGGTVIVGGTVSVGEPVGLDQMLPSCLTDSSSVWYTLIGNGQKLTASTCHPGSSSDHRTKLTVLLGTAGSDTDAGSGSGSGTSCESLTCISDTVTTECGNHMSATWQSIFGQRYFVAVTIDAADDGATNPPLTVPFFALTVERTALNDGCEAAIGPMIMDGSPRIGSTRSATRSNFNGAAGDDISDFPVCLDDQTSTTIAANANANVDGRDVWYTVVGNGFDLAASTCSIYTQFQTHITVYKGDSCGSLGCVDTTHFSSCGILFEGFDLPGSSTTWSSEENVVYYIRVAGVELEFDYGIFELKVRPVNDVCDRAVPMTIDSTSQTSALVSGTTQGELHHDTCFEDPLGIFMERSGVWYTVQGTGTRMFASTCDTDSLLPTRVSIYIGSMFSSPSVNFCSLLTCDVSSEMSVCGEHGTTTTHWDSVASTRYYILVQSMEEVFDLRVGEESGQ